MKKRSVYRLPKIGVLAILSALFMLASAVVRIVWLGGESGLSTGFIWTQAVLPLVCNFAFIIILFRDGGIIPEVK